MILTIYLLTEYMFSREVNGQPYSLYFFTVGLLLYTQWSVWKAFIFEQVEEEGLLSGFFQPFFQFHDHELNKEQLVLWLSQVTSFKETRLIIISNIRVQSCYACPTPTREPNMHMHMHMNQAIALKDEVKTKTRTPNNKTIH